MRLLDNLDSLHVKDGTGYEHYLMRSLLATHARLVALTRERLPDDG